MRQFSGERGPELQDPPPHGLVRDVQPPLGEQILNVAKAKSEPEIEPDGVSNDLRRELVARK
jgi:hypothetical protein